jgi:hypothetical protein
MTVAKQTFNENKWTCEERMAVRGDEVIALKLHKYNTWMGKGTNVHRQKNFVTNKIHNSKTEVVKSNILFCPPVDYICYSKPLESNPKI